MRLRIKGMTAKRRMKKGEEAEHPLGMLDTSSLPGARGPAGRSLGSSAH